MNHKAWLIALAAAVAITTGCSKEETPPSTPPAPAMETSVEKTAPQAAMEPAMDKAHEGMKTTDEAAATSMADGKAIYEKTCFACHDTGVSGAPKLGDKAAWGGHLPEGIDHLIRIAIEGEGAMPPRGGNPDLSDEEIRAAVGYMLDQAR